MTKKRHTTVNDNGRPNPYVVADVKRKRDSNKDVIKTVKEATKKGFFNRQDR